MLSGVSKTPELALEESEAAELATALSTVNSFYRVEVAEKTLAWINLAMVGGMIYGSRLIAIRERRSSERPQQRRQSSGFASAQPMPSPVGEVPEDLPVNDAPPAFTADVAEPPETFIPGDFGAFKLN